MSAPLDRGAVIVDAAILPADRKAGRYQAEVIAELADGETAVVLKYYDDELFFTAGEFVGITVGEAYALFMRKDLAYLQS